MIKKILIALLLIFLIIQFFRPAKNIQVTENKNDIGLTFAVPDSIHKVLQKACYDCHSNNTNYPWYSHVQPIAWWLADHVKDGKDELNFSEFGAFKKKRQLKKLKELGKQVEEKEMPLKSYLLMHKEASLTKRERQMLISWAKELSEKIAAENKN